MSLTIVDDWHTKTVRVDIAPPDLTEWHAWINVSIGHAGFIEENVLRVRFCADCPEVYFLEVWNASSTFGAQTGIAVWPRAGRWWELTILPLVRPRVEDADGDSISTVVETIPKDHKVNYTFRDGLLLPLE